MEASMQVWIPSDLLSTAVLSRSIVPGTFTRDASPSAVILAVTAYFRLRKE